MFNAPSVTVLVPSVTVLVPSDNGTCNACGKPSDTDFCFRPECITFGKK